MFSNIFITDTESIYESSNRQLAEEFGKKYTPETRAKVLGVSEQQTAEIIVKELKLPMSKGEYLRRIGIIQNAMFEKAKLMPGAERLVRHLSQNKIPIALATSSGKASVEAKMKGHKDLFSLFHHAVIGSSDPEVKAGKPAPDVFLICASRYPDKPDPSKCLVFEDAPNGVLAAKRAKMQVVMIPEKKPTEEQRSHATLVLDSLLDFKPELFGLPPFK
uniref:Uncharacterized protein n=1 Tax=Clastoptera arizonana TaxID=38151 RepID=A0A1B6C8D4_9HEMI